MPLTDGLRKRFSVWERISIMIIDILKGDCDEDPLSTRIK